MKHETLDQKGKSELRESDMELRREEIESESEPEVIEELSAEERILGLESSLDENQATIDRVKKDMEARRQELNRVREDLGLPILEDDPDRDHLARLEFKQKEIREEKEQMVSLKELNTLLGLMAKLSEKDQREAMRTGRDKDGKLFKVGDQSVNPEVAKKIAESALNGVKKITEAMLKGFLALVGNILAALFSKGEEGEVAPEAKAEEVQS